jgi:phosphatidylglycerophosphate synthase
LPRCLSIYVTAVLVRTPIKPNHITAANMLFSISAIVVLWPMKAWNYVLYVLLLFVVAVIDCCDGEIARFKDLRSNSGLYLDISEATISRSLMFIALGVFFYLHNHSLWVLVSGFLAANSYLLLKVLHYTMFRVVPGQMETITGMLSHSFGLLNITRYLLEVIVLKPPATYAILLANALLLYLFKVDNIGWILLGFTSLHTLAVIWQLLSVGILHTLDR